MTRWLTFEISGMTCEHSRSAVVQALKGLGGLTHVTVDLASGRAMILPAADADPATLCTELVAEVEALGYAARLAPPD